MHNYVKLQKLEFNIIMTCYILNFSRDKFFDKVNKRLHLEPDFYIIYIYIYHVFVHFL